MRQTKTIILFRVFTFYQFCSVQPFNTEMLKFKPVHAYFAQVCSFQILFTILIALLLMSVDILSQKEFTRTKRKFEGLTQSIKG